MVRAFLCLWLSTATCGAAGSAAACEVALVLAVDVSGLVDAQEYRVQMQGLADGLRDGAVSEALVVGEAAVLVLQWTGSSRQRVVVPWQRLTDFDAVEMLAARIETTPRVWRNFSTAIGEALEVGAAQFADVLDCERRVIDVSGDGSSNEGPDPGAMHGLLTEKGITVNALVIEGAEPMMTEYFWENVIHGPGAFVITANDYDAYPARMRRKLLREVTKPISKAPGDSFAPHL
jgi:Ca-activated chloride channel family protein